jgi:hypothetical protein
MKWRIIGTVDNNLYAEEDPIIFSDTVEGDDMEDALDKLDSTLHELATNRGWKMGDYDIHTTDPMPVQSALD